MVARFVDFHCHLDLCPDPTTAIADADAAGVYTLTVTTTPRAWPHNLTLTRGTRHVRAALGLHPQLVAEHSHEISIWDNYLSQTPYVGEVGLDAGPRYYRSLDLQRQIFEHILKQCAKAGGKILTIHSVRATTMVLDLIETHLPPEHGQAVLHWFTGSKAEARRAADLGCYFSVNAPMLASDRGRDLVISLPADRLLTETDGPFTKVSGRPACPADVEITIEALANLRKVTPTEMTALIVGNLKTLLDLGSVRVWGLT
jgi:TatD DNase family protein